MVKYELMGFNSLEEYLKYFLETLLPTNRTYNYFVDWKKVKEHARKYIKEINLLNALTKVKKDERRNLLKEILLKYPETISVIPIILAVREKNLVILEITDKLDYKKFNFNQRKISENEADQLLLFCEKTGIIDLFDEINDLYAYVIGVEVGIDTNTRKNRSGKIFQELVGMLINRALSKVNYWNRLRLDTEISLEKLGISIRRKEKTVDYVIYAYDSPKVVIECNFYNVVGSKPIEVASSYIDLYKLLKEKKIGFIWITDGPAWKKMINPLTQAIQEIEYLLNLKLAEEYLDKILPYIIVD